MIDPISALEGIQKAIKLVKKAAQTAQDVSSLAPMIGKMFDARSTATKAMVESKRSGGSNMGTALQIEMALDEAKRFEAELQMLFMQSGRIDVWQKIKERSQQMDIEDAHSARQAKADAKKKKEEQEEQIAIVAGVFVLIILFLGAAIGISEFQEYCAKVKCGR
jgi:CII-binding regulator of phage lambda lysogenization HflD